MKSYIKILRIIITVFFIGFILLPLLNGFFKVIPEFEDNENRAKQKSPKFSLSTIDRYSHQFEDYFTNNFSLRNNFIHILHRFEYHFFRVSPAPEKVIVGKDGWFYAKKSVSAYKGDNLFSEYELHILIDELKARINWADEHGIKYYIAIVPNKMNVYPEYLPNNIINISKFKMYDQLIELNEQYNLNIIDIRKNILSHKNDQHILYQKTDDHWNSLGAFWGYDQIMSCISEDFIELNANPIDSFNINLEIRKGNIANLIYATEKNPEHFIALNKKSKSVARDGNKKGYSVPTGISEWEYELVKVNSNAPNLKCLIIRDSFALQLIKFFQEHFKKLVLIHGEWEYKLDKDLIISENPDLVINIILESELKKFLDFPFQKTVKYYANRLRTSNEQFELIKQKAKKNNLSIEKMIILESIWLFHNTYDDNKRVDLDYYRFLYMSQDSLQHELNNLSNELNLSMEESIDSCARKSYLKYISDGFN